MYTVTYRRLSQIREPTNFNQNSLSEQKNLFIVFAIKTIQIMKKGKRSVNKRKLRCHTKKANCPVETVKD